MAFPFFVNLRKYLLKYSNILGRGGEFFSITKNNSNFALNNYMEFSHINEIKNKISDSEDSWKEGKMNRG